MDRDGETGDRHDRAAILCPPHAERVRRTRVCAGGLEQGEAVTDRLLRTRIISVMARKSAESVRCALCGTKEVSEPRGDERYCHDCWDKKIAVEDVVAREFTLKR